ncbi:phage integrase SAM-like domain-containing protein [Ureibacillus sp. NPDC094379]
MLLSEAWKKYQDKKIEGYSSLTLKTYRFQYNLLLRFFGDIDMNTFTTEKLKEYLIKSGVHLKPSSLSHRIRCVKSLFRWSHEEGYILKNPVAKLKSENNSFINK